jgi:hypothetical protein
MSQRTVSSWGQLVDLRPSSENISPETTERRAWVRYVCELLTICQPTNLPTKEALLARVRNISRGGASLVIDQKFENGTILSVELPGPDGEPMCSLLACVIHAISQTGGDWSLGCSFVRELNDNDLHPYGAKQQPTSDSDQRSWVRFACDVEASYRIVRVTERSQAPARVFDISPRGVGLLVDRSIQPGTVLSVELRGSSGQSNLRIFACVVRVTELKNGEWALGCNFIREINDEELLALLPQNEAQAARP